MSAYYLDASAAVKGYVAERGSRKVLRLLEEGSENEMHLGRIGVVEVFAALFRRAAFGEEVTEEAVSAAARFREDLRYSYRIVEFSVATAERAVEVAGRHRLRAYDCLQLVTLLVLQEQRVIFGLASLVLLSSDGELNDAAAAEGMLVEDPAAS